MVWLLGIGLFIIFWYVFPPFRKFVLVVATVLVLLFAGYALYLNHEEAVEKSLIPFSQVELTKLGLEHGRMSGEVKNNSDHSLSSLDLEIKAYDCPTSLTIKEFRAKLPADLSDEQLAQSLHKNYSNEENGIVLKTPPSPACTTIGQDSVHYWDTMVPPHQVRAINSHVSFTNLPAVQGVFRWSYEITGTRGR
jgi:hypothetical protein